MSTKDIYFAIIENQPQAVQITIDQANMDDGTQYLAVYAVNREVNNMLLEDLLKYLPAFHNDPNGYIKRAGIRLYSGQIT